MNEYSPRKKLLMIVSLTLIVWLWVFVAMYGAVRMLERFGLL